MNGFKKIIAFLMLFVLILSCSTEILYAVPVEEPEKADIASAAGGYVAQDDMEGFYEEEKPFEEMVNVPVIGTVAAGTPILATENVEDTMTLPMNLVRNNNSFMLKVKGDSMINVGILDGDQILVERCSSARNGDTVVALVDDSATVKTFYKEANHIRLQPENDTMDPIIVDDCEIMGKVFGVFRFF